VFLERMLVRKPLSLAVFGIVAVIGPSTAAAQTQTLFLDSRDPGRDQYTEPVKTKKLRAGRPYVVNVRGTVSFYKWRASDVRCGAAEPKPIYRTRRVRNGIVGADSEFVFADKATGCNRRLRAGNTVPESWLGFQVSQGRGFFKMSLLNPTTTPLPDHAYDYAILGYGTRARFRLRDANTRDNYGRLRIRLRRATAADCTGGRHAAWGFATEADCAAKALPAPAG
jgi:hypothetical protein